VPRIPPDGFGIGFGLVGLAGMWLAAADAGLTPFWIGNALLALAALVWLAVIGGYSAYALSHRDTLRTDLTHPVLAPFVSLALITPMVLAARGVEPFAHTTGTVLVDVFIALTVLHGAWFTGQLIYAEYSVDQLHPGYFLPTVAGGLVAATSAAEMGQHQLGVVLFGYGVICWAILGSMILGRLIFRPALPPPLQPTLAIEIAPAAVASLGWFALGDGRIDGVAQFLAGYGVLMVLAQIRLLPAFLGLRFALGFWSFTFAWAAVGTSALHGIVEARPAGWISLAWVVLAAISALIGGIAVRTVIALRKGHLFPRAPDVSGPATEPTSTPAPTSQTRTA
jgi:tellurite resistance protein